MSLEEMEPILETGCTEVRLSNQMAPILAGPRLKTSKLFERVGLIRLFETIGPGRLFSESLTRLNLGIVLI
jgi:hypothetical protein